MDEIVYWLLCGWAALVILTAVIAWITDSPVKAFVALAIFCTPIVSLADADCFVAQGVSLKAAGAIRGRRRLTLGHTTMTGHLQWRLRSFTGQPPEDVAPSVEYVTVPCRAG